MDFNTREVKDLWVAGIMISLAFAILLSGGINAILYLKLSMLGMFVVAFFTAGLGFLLHELMHKYVAQRYGLYAEFVAFYPMLWLAIGLSLFGFIFAAPGAVMIRGMITKEKNGKIALAGPVANIALAIIFLLSLLFTPQNTFMYSMFSYGLSINALLAAFNMIPAMPFDGAKIIAWSKKAYVSTLIISLVLFVTSLIL